jgi:hypothetical protein
MEFVTYKKFYEKERAEALMELLSKSSIEHQLVSDRESLDSLYGHDHLNRFYFIKLRAEDFSQADQLLLSINERELESVGKDHYLYEFTDEELFEILAKPDEWNEFDYLLSRKILRERGRDISDHTIDLLKKQRIKDLAKPDENHRHWMYAGYVFAFLGGLIGIFIGWHLNTFKKTLPNGERVYAYNEDDRKHGMRILIIGTIMFVLVLISNISRQMLE